MLFSGGMRHQWGDKNLVGGVYWVRGIFPAGGGGMSNFFGKPRTLGATNLGASRLTHPYEYVLTPPVMCL